MKIVVQRVTQGSVAIKDKIVGKISKGFVVMVGFRLGERPEKLKRMAEKLVNLRIMADKDGRMNLALKDVRGDLLLVPQFTLYADTSSRRPGFSPAEKPQTAAKLFDDFVSEVKKSGLKVETGKFGTEMQVEIHNDGPVTIILEC